MGRGPFTHSVGKHIPHKWLVSRAVVMALLVMSLFFAARVSSLPLTDSPPYIAASNPTHNASRVIAPKTLTLTFSEPVALADNAVTLNCSFTQNITLNVSGGPTTFTFSPSKTIGPNEDCTITVSQLLVTDLDTADPPDHMSADGYVNFHTVLATAQDVIINEIDAVAGASGHEFVELYDGGSGNTALDGLQIAFYNGVTDKLYGGASLTGYKTNANGYFLLSSDPTTADLLLANGYLLDGPAAAALYSVPGSKFPIGSPVMLTGLTDAVVYDTGQADDPGLLPLLETNEPQINEAANGQAAAKSNQRCPNATGGPRRTSTYQLSAPTPAAANACVLDAPPSVITTLPQSGANVDPLDLQLQVTFSEPVSLKNNAITLDCLKSGHLALSVSGGPEIYTAVPQTAAANGDTCSAFIAGEMVSDLDTIDPPDTLVTDVSWTFGTIKTVATDMLINEVDSDTPGYDAAEFIELYDGGKGSTILDGLTLVLYNGSSGKSYRAIDLSSYQTDAAGYLVIGNSSVPGNDITIADASLQNGPDAVALYIGSANDFPNGTLVTTSNLIDALVYGPAGSSAPALMVLLESGQSQVDENSRGSGDLHSNQRCPNGSGAHRQSITFRPNTPTPKAANICVADDAPWVTATSPTAGALDVPIGVALSVGFSEAVETQQGWFQLNCTLSGAHSIQSTGGPLSFTLTSVTPLANAEQCVAKVSASLVNDLDGDDPPDQMSFDFTWTFATADAAANFVVINEVDSNTPGVDTAEFIELYDGGRGQTSLEGLTVVLFNGSGATSYQALGLDGHKTDAEGYFVIGSAAVNGVDLITSNGLIQNGTDAIALFAASSSSFPNNTAVTTTGLLDALVYGNAANDGLQVLLNAGQAIVDENGAGSAETQSMQRCPNGSGGPRNTNAIRLGPPTPGQPSSCPTDVAPQLVATSPADAATGVPTTGVLELAFSEPVQLASDAVSLYCDDSGTHTVMFSGGPVEFTLTPASPFQPGEACYAALLGSGVTDLDTIDPPDTMGTDVNWAFETAAMPTEGILISEFDADTPGTDTAEFIELYDGGKGNQSLDGYSLVLFNGQNDLSYRTIDLQGTQTDSNGFLVIGGPGVSAANIPLPVGALQNGPDAIALFRAAPQQFPNGTPISLNNLADAIVYGTADPDDTELLALLLPGQPQIDESSRGHPADDSNQRCAAIGVARETAGFTQSGPTPGAANDCLTDDAPQVEATTPVNGSVGVATSAGLTVVFSEAVITDPGWLHLECETTGAQAVTIQGGPITYSAVPNLPLPVGKNCVATISAAKVHDADASDPPDTLPLDVTWSFVIETAECALDYTPISSVQGNGPTSPLQSQIVTTMGVITADFREGLGGFYIQTPDGQSDTNPATSEGILVVLSDETEAITIGDRVMVTGRVAELKQRTALIDADITAVCGQSVTVSPRTLKPLPGSAAGWEALEGMLVTLEQATIADNSRLQSSGELSVILAERPIYPTEYQLPGPNARTALEANWSRMLVLDDGRIGTAPVNLLSSVVATRSFRRSRLFRCGRS